jgi:HNH endonuclease
VSGTETTLRDRTAEVQAYILSRVERNDNDCWVWTGYINPKGYGKCQIKGFGQMAHRVSYQAFVGPIPDGLTIDHLCRTRNCANPEHLEPVSQRENSMRGDTIPAHHAAKTHCKNGHPLSGENLYRDSRQRHCRICVRENGRRYRARKRAAQAQVAG